MPTLSLHIESTDSMIITENQAGLDRSRVVYVASIKHSKLFLSTVMENWNAFIYVYSCSPVA